MHFLNGYYLSFVVKKKKLRNFQNEKCLLIMRMLMNNINTCIEIPKS